MQNIILTGFMGTGKTTVGRILASRLSCPFLDIDSLVEEMEGKSIPEIFAEQGEEYFRQAETRALVKALEGGGRVISTGGGAMLREKNRRLLREGGLLVCLTAGEEEIFRRVGGGGGRPLLQGEDTRGKIRGLLRERQPYYRLAPVVIPTDGRSPEETAGEIMLLLQKKK